MINTTVNSKELITPGKDPISLSILNFTQTLAERAEVLTAQVEGKLNPVMQTPVLSPDIQKSEVMKVYPPLFSDLRDKLIRIESCLNYIENCLSRTEL